MYEVMRKKLRFVLIIIIQKNGNVFDILKITIPSVIVFLTAWVLLRNMISNDQDKRRQEIIMQNSRTILPSVFRHMSG